MIAQTITQKQWRSHFLFFLLVLALFVPSACTQRQQPDATLVSSPDTTSPVWSVDLDPNGNILAAGFMEGNTKLHTFGSPSKSNIPSVAFTPDSHMLATAGDGTIQLWDVQGWTLA